MSIWMVFSCSLPELQEKEIISNDPSLDIQIISIEEALDNLNSFMSDVELTTKHIGRKISTIDAYYGMNKSIDPAIPVAYLVNFENESGFAILGANNKMDDVIALTESGSTTWDKLLAPMDKNEKQESEYSDISPDEMMSLCIRSALFGHDEDSTDVTTKSGTYYNVVLPLTEGLDFYQIHTYCHKNNHNFVISGCASVALAIVVAYNQYPPLRVDYSTINYTNINTYDGVGYHYLLDFADDIYIQPSDYFFNYGSIPSNPTEAQLIALLPMIQSNIYNDHQLVGTINSQLFPRTQYKLISGMHYVLSNIVTGWNATGTMPGAFEDGLEDLGYTNVSKTSASYLSSSQISTIQSMLNNQKPVVLCGWTLTDLTHGHYWVVDGIRTTTDNKYHIHCNWGWGSNYNGWFSTDCIRKTEAVEYDTKSGDSGNAWNNLIVYEYSIGTTPSVSYNVVEFIQNHKVIYQP